MTTTESIRLLVDFDAEAFGASLIAAGAVSAVDWQLARQVAAEGAAAGGAGSPVRALLDLGLIGEAALADRLAAFGGCGRWTADGESRALSEVAPPAFLRSLGGLVLEGDGGPPVVVCADPSDEPAWSSLLGLLPAAPEVLVGTAKEIAAYLDERGRQAGGVAAEAGADEAAGLDISAEVDQLRDMASEAPVIRFLNQTVERAMELGASDIHLERFDHASSLRLRVDGLLLEQAPPAGWMIDPLLCRIKIMAGLDIAERRRAQDGRIQMRLRGRMVDLRVSLLPTLYGQDAVLRLQDRQKLGAMTLDGLGFERSQIAAIERAASKSHGMVLVTGPTGSGKTTTLYALLRRLIDTTRKVVTVEDPVEYAIDGVNQVNVNAAIGRTFSSALRHILRHDPDVILVGEIRDRETAEMAFQAALTGHMVLSTLHTNDVPSTFTRLLDIGIEPFLINAAVECVTAQRLLRRVCAVCGNDAAAREGCAGCGGVGYRGRTAIMEHAIADGAVKRAVREQADERRMAEVLAAAGFRSLRQHAEALAREGVTDEAEIARALGPAADLAADGAGG